MAFLHVDGLDGRLASPGPEAVAAELDELVSVVQRSVEDHGVAFLSSDIDRDGAKIVLVAGAPRGTGHDEESMLLALRAVIEAGTAIPVRVGVNTGAVFAGEIGTRHRRCYTVMGDPVNLAARVMGRASSGQILATVPVLERSRTLFRAEPLEPFAVKGKREPVVAAEVGPAHGVRSEIASSDVPLTGRDAELECLDDVAISARQGRGRWVEIVAEPGSGKSRLLHEFVRRQPGLAVHRVGCRLYQRDSPYFPTAHLLGLALGLPDTSPEDRVTALRSIVASACPALEPWVSLIGVPLQLDIEPSDEVAQLDAEFRRARLNAVVLELLTSVLTDPVLLCVEDAHWMDDASADLIDSLGGSVASRPWILLVTRRPDGGRSHPDADALTRIDLEPLDRASAADLVRAATRDDPLPGHVVESLAARSDGNPLFLLELLHAVRSGHDVDSLPTSVEALITARIDALPATDRSFLRRASVLGSGFFARHLAAVAAEGDGLDDSEPDSAVSRLHDFLAVDDSRWVTFRHALVRDVAYGGLPFRTRRTLHSQVADSILAEAGGERSEVVTLLSPHLFHAHRDAEAWTCSIEAGDRARAMFANLDAAASYERALVVARRLGDVPDAERATVHEALGDVQDLAGLYDDSRRSFAQAGRLAGEDAVRQAAVLLKAAYVAEHQGEYTTAIRAVRRGLRAIDGGDGAGRRRPTRQAARVGGGGAGLSGPLPRCSGARRGRHGGVTGGRGRVERRQRPCSSSTTPT